MEKEFFSNMRSINKSIVAFDLDGTIINECGELYPGVHDGVRKIKNKGLKCIIITGRNVQSFQSLSLSIEFLELFEDCILCEEGNVVYNWKNKKITIRNSLPVNTFSNVFDNINKLNFVWISNGKLFFSNRSALLYYCALYNIKNCNTAKDDIEEEKKEYNNITFLLLFIKNHDIEEFIDTESDKYQSELISGKLSRLKISPINTCKSVNLNGFLKKQYRLNLNNVISFGNDHKDYNLIKNSGLGIAVENCTSDLINVADIHLNKPIGLSLQNLFK